jgi:peroxiredoxin/tetratricopeptide (TPR) repeat protein
MSILRTLSIVFVLLSVLQVVRADDEPGHSRHGAAFDSGLRQRPWRMEGIGKTHFPITTKVPEVQEWFDQGNTLLHSFWYEEAERSFRWCLKLDPECAMAYWGLARCGGIDAAEGNRYADFLKQAVRRKATVSPRERMYIEAWEAAYTGEVKDPRKELAKRLQQIVLKYPEDVEAQALLALHSLGQGNAYGTELILQQILAKEPDHPGAHHYRIHNWDGVAPEEAIRSCERYGIVAPNIGHAAHMPGHIYSKVGMWHEAARAMESATRVELRYMNERLALPFETWNYAHNRNYLCYIQEQLGMPEASLQGARNLLAAPRDPERNKDGNYGAYDQGLIALVRALIKFERWEEILKPGAIPWRDLPSDKELRAFAETLAYIGQGKLTDASARLDDLKASVRAQAAKNNEATVAPAIPADSAEGLLRAAQGDILEATRLLTEAAALEQKKRDAGEYTNDPPRDPWPVMRVLGDVYRKRGEYRLAVEAYQRSLAQEPNDAFSLSGLAQAQFELGDRTKAERYSGRLLAVWSGADPDLKWRNAVAALGLNARPIAETPVAERPYRPEMLASLGPINWEPHAAPQLDGVDVNGQHVRLEEFRGKNVLLVFYLNDECVHCVEQLTAINARSADWSKENTVVLAVSSLSPEKNKGSQKLGNLTIRLLSDPNHENARRFASYDDFEEIELHSTILIDRQGRVHWKRTGGDPFTDMEFLMQTVKRMNGEPDPKS